MRHPSVNPRLDAGRFNLPMRSSRVSNPAKRVLVCRGAVCATQVYPSIVCMSAMRTNREFSACR